MNALIRLLYSLLVAVSVLVFVGVAIYSFYQPPKSPVYPTYDATASTATIDKQQNNYNAAEKTYQAKQKPYQKHVAITLIVISLLVVASGILMLKGSPVIGEGIALGGVATTVYAIISASIAESRPVRFIAVTLLLLSVLILVQRRFLPDRHHA